MNYLYLLSLLLTGSLCAVPATDACQNVWQQDYEPFLVLAKEKFAEGNYAVSRDICEELRARCPNNEKVKECVARASRQIEQLQKDEKNIREALKKSSPPK